MPYLLKTALLATLAIGLPTAGTADGMTTLAIPQYVQITWDASVLEEFRQPIMFGYPGEEWDIPPPTNVTIFAGCSVAEAATAFAEIPSKVQAMFPPNVNIIVVGPETTVPQPHKTVVIQTDQYVDPATGAKSRALGRTPNEHCHQRNDSPWGTAYVYDGMIRESITNAFLNFYVQIDGEIDPTDDWRHVPLPFSASLLTDYIAQEALHECCHAMGLVPTSSAAHNGHNVCTCGRHHMDRGREKKVLMRLGFVTPSHIPSWMPKNERYLEFVTSLPK